MRIELTVERLILDGFGIEPRHTCDLRQAIVTDLVHRLANTPVDTWRSSSGHHQVVRACIRRVGDSVDPQRFGAEIADVIHREVAEAGLRGDRVEP